MIQVKIRILTRDSSAEAIVWAESVKRAVELAGQRYSWDAVEVVFPIDPERFFAGSRDPAIEEICLIAPEGPGPETGAAGLIGKPGRPMVGVRYAREGDVG